MPYRRLGQAGMKVSALSLGGWTTFGSSVSEQEQVTAIMKAAFEAGVTFFDIADVYARGEAERVMGSVLKQFPRNELVISSKVFWPMSDDVNDRGLSRKHIKESVERSLQRIGTDYLDLYFCHRFDDDTPVDETARAMDDLVHQGKILYWGTSEWSGAQIDVAHGIASARGLYAPAVEQPQYSLLARAKVDHEVAPVADKHGMGLVVWSPLASGVLTGKYDAGIPPGSRLDRIEWLRGTFLSEDTRSRVKRFSLLADEAGVSRARLALAWALSRPGISSVITGATTLAQLKENLGALTVKITDDLARKLDELFPAS